jgi:hypothetical protein
VPNSFGSSFFKTIMDIKELVKQEHFTTEDMLYVVTLFIKDKKGVDVSINPPNTNIRAIMLNNFFNKAMDYYQPLYCAK